MTAEEIMTLKDVNQQFDLLEKNLSPLSDAEIKGAIDFYLGEHPIKTDENLEDETIKEKYIDPETNEVTWKSRTKVHTKLCLPYAQQIVMTDAAFIMGNGINLVFNSDDQKDIDSYDKFIHYWKNSNVISSFRDVASIRAVETRAALQFFYDKDSDKIKAKVLCLKYGYRIWRHMDDNRKVDAVVVNYLRDDIVNGELQQNIDTTEIYTKKKWYRYEGNILLSDFPKNNPKGTTKLLIGYFEQSYPEFWFVMDLISKQDYARSQHNEVNTKIGNPAMVVNGELKTKPKMNEAVPIFEITPSKSSLGDSKTSTADMKYLEISSAPESVKLEMENNERDIYRFTYPDLYALIEKSISGNLSSKSITLMFTHVFAKIAEEQTIWDDMIRRCISIFKDIVAAVTGDVNVRNLDIDFKYNSILPSSTDDLVNMLAVAVGAHLTTYEHAASQIDFNDPQTVKTIKDLYDKVQKAAAENPQIVKPKNKNVPNPSGVNGN